MTERDIFIAALQKEDAAERQEHNHRLVGRGLEHHERADEDGGEQRKMQEARGEARITRGAAGIFSRGAQ